MYQLGHDTVILLGSNLFRLLTTAVGRQMAQYSFVFWNSTGADRAQRRFLFPLGDLANHKYGLLFVMALTDMFRSP